MFNFMSTPKFCHVCFGIKFGDCFDAKKITQLMLESAIDNQIMGKMSLLSKIHVITEVI